MTTVRAHGVLTGRGGAVRRGGIVRYDAVVAIIAGAFTAVSEDVVGGGDVGEASICVGIVAIAIGMVREGKGVELSVRGRKSVYLYLIAAVLISKIGYEYEYEYVRRRGERERN